MSPQPEQPKTLVEITDYSLVFDGFDGTSHVLDGVSLSIAEGEAVGLVGETGCGKSVLVKSLLRLIEMPPGRVLGGAIRFDGKDVLGARGTALQALRTGAISMVFQDPTTFLNPLFRVGAQLDDVISVRGSGDLPAARRREIASALVSSVGLADPDGILDRFPHELSGGMRQRILIAMALAGDPRLLIADEPTTALDVTVQSQILRLIADLVSSRGLTLGLVSHDLGVIGAMCRRVVVRYAGTIVEDAPVDVLFAGPRHPSTQGLIAATPDLAHPERVKQAMPGMLPDLSNPPSGCRFAERCAHAMPRCQIEKPLLRAVAPAHGVACHLQEHA